MRVFITGGSGFIGRACIQELLQNGHQVICLARTDESAATITQAGAEVLRGDIEDIDALRKGAKETDGVIHLAFPSSFTEFSASCAIERAAISAMVDEMAGTGKPFVLASGTLSGPLGQLATEDSEPDRDHPPFSERVLSADLLYKLSKEKNVRGSVVKLSPTTHGLEDKSFVPMMIDLARKNRFVTYVGDGSSRWPAVHRLDAAVLLRLALEKGKPAGTYHAVADQGNTMKDMATLIGKLLELPVVSKTQEEAVEVIGFLAYVASMDNPVSSEKTQKELGWKPVQMSLFDDIEANYIKR